MPSGSDLVVLSGPAMVGLVRAVASLDKPASGDTPSLVAWPSTPGSAKHTEQATRGTCTASSSTSTSTPMARSVQLSLQPHQIYGRWCGTPLNGSSLRMRPEPVAGCALVTTTWRQSQPMTSAMSDSHSLMRCPSAASASDRVCGCGGRGDSAALASCRCSRRPRPRADEARQAVGRRGCDVGGHRPRGSGRARALPR